MSRPINEKRPGELRNAIVIKHGLNGLSLRPLAKALGCTPRVLLYHFGSKEKMVIEVLNSAGDLFPWESHYHPQEHVLQLTKDDVLALPAAIRSFNGFYTIHGKFTMENSIRILIAFAILVLAVVVAVVWTLVRYIRRRRPDRKLRREIQD
jgi:AcrR family transcriptional regulator